MLPYNTGSKTILVLAKAKWPTFAHSGCDFFTTTRFTEDGVRLCTVLFSVALTIRDSFLAKSVILLPQYADKLTKCPFFYLQIVFAESKNTIFHFGWKNTLCLKLRHTVALCTRDNKKRDYIRTNTIAKLVKSS
jgi:hypothetical protein